MLKQLCLGIAFFTLHSASGQESALAVGIKWVDDLTLYHGLAPGFGGQVTYRLGRHAGVESGVYYSTWDHHFIFGDANGYATTKIAERHLYFPFLYRHEARRLNLSGFIKSESTEQIEIVISGEKEDIDLYADFLTDEIAGVKAFDIESYNKPIVNGFYIEKL